MGFQESKKNIPLRGQETIGAAFAKAPAEVKKGSFTLPTLLKL